MAQYLLIFAAFIISSLDIPSLSFSIAVADPVVALLLTLVALCLAPIPAVIFARWVYRKSFARTLHLHRRGYSLYRALCSLFLLADFAAVVLFCSWGSVVDDLGFTRLAAFHGLLWSLPVALLLVLGDLLRLLPFLVMLLLAWVPLYRVDLILLRGSWSLADYIVFHLRQYVFFLLVPISAFLLIGHLWAVFPADFCNYLVSSRLVYCLSALLLLLVLIFLPLLLRFVWKTRPLPPGPLLARLEALLASASLRCRRILLWDTYGGQMVNACVTGFIRHTRYILVTDSLIAALTPDEIAAVFAHEIAHVKRHHLFLYLLFALGSAPLVLLPALLITRLPNGDLLSQLWLYPALLLYWGLAFGYFSRRMELEADLDAVVLCGSTFNLVNSLEKLALSSGRPRDSRSWRHFSIARRVDFLTSLIDNPSASLSLRRRFLILKCSVLALAIISLITLICYPPLFKSLLS